MSIPDFELNKIKIYRILADVKCLKYKGWAWVIIGFEYIDLYFNLDGSAKWTNHKDCHIHSISSSHSPAGDECISISFEQVLELVSDEIAEELICHMDLLR